MRPIRLGAAALVVLGAFGAPANALAQAEIGNRANGLSYQPTPAEVRPRETAAGLRPSQAQQTATDQELRSIDKELLRHEGKSTKNVPDMQAR